MNTKTNLVSPHSNLDLSLDDIHTWLNAHRRIAIMWSVKNVKAVRPHLTDGQAWEVLQRCDRLHDYEIGLTWELIEDMADYHFPNSGNLVSPHSNLDLSLDDIHTWLNERRRIAIVWSVENVKDVRPHLTDEQAWEVLQRCNRLHDCAVGLTWDLIEDMADCHFPNPEKKSANAITK